MAINTEYLTVSDVPQIIPLKPATVRAWILRRKIPYLKLGRRVFVRRSDLEKLIESSMVPARPQRDET